MATVNVAEIRNRAYDLAARVLLDEYAGYRRVKVFAVGRYALNVSVRAHVSGHHAIFVFFHRLLLAPYARGEQRRKHQRD